MTESVDQTSASPTRSVFRSASRTRDSSAPEPRRAAGQPAGPEGSITKIAKAGSNQRLQETAVGIRGADATAWGHDDVSAEDWVHQFLRTRANSIEGGTSEIMKNILGERVLGLPGEPRVDTDLPWTEIKRG